MVRYLGTPAEERHGGKELMARLGAFDGADAAMMMHPSNMNLMTMPCIASRRCGSDLSRPRRARLRHAVSRAERARRRGLGLSGDRPAAPAHPGQRAHPRHHHRGRHGAEHRAGARRLPLLRARRRRATNWRRSRRACRPASRPAPSPTGCRLETQLERRRLSRSQDQLADGRAVRAPGARAGPRLLPDEGHSARASPARPTWAMSATACRRSIRCSPWRRSGVIIHNPEFARWAASETGRRRGDRRRQGDGADRAAIDVRRRIAGSGARRFRGDGGIVEACRRQDRRQAAGADILMRMRGAAVRERRRTTSTLSPTPRRTIRGSSVSSSA